MKIYVTAMSVPQNIVMNKLIDISSSLTDHLIKLYLFPTSQYTNHWRQEIFSFVNSIPKLKSTKRYPSSDFIFEHLSSYLDQCAEGIEFWINEYGSLVPERVDPIEAENLITEYIKWLASKLSENGRVSASEIYAKLTELTL